MSNLEYSYTVTKYTAYYTIDFTITNTSNNSYNNWLLYFSIPRNQSLFNYSSCLVLNPNVSGTTFYTVVGDNSTDTILPNSKVQFTLNIAAEYGYVATGPFFIELNQAPTIIPELSTSYPNNITLNGNFQVQWNTTPGTELYYLQLSNDGTFTSDVYSIYTKNNYYNFNSMAPGTYIFRIASLNSYGQTGWSGPLNVYVPSPTISVPSLSIESPPVNGEFTLQWTANTNAKLYVLIQANDMFYTQNVVVYTTTSTNETLTLPSGTYYFKVATLDNTTNLYSYFSLPVAVNV